MHWIIPAFDFGTDQWLLIIILQNFIWWLRFDSYLSWFSLGKLGSGPAGYALFVAVYAGLEVREAHVLDFMLLSISTIERETSWYSSP